MAAAANRAQQHNDGEIGALNQTTLDDSQLPLYGTQNVLPGAYAPSFADAKPILICPGDFAGNGREYRHALGEGLYCQMTLSDGVTPCQEVAYWYCD